jgi:hypothetical protein
MKDLLFDIGLELSPPRPPDPSLLISQAVPSKKHNDNLLNTFQIAFQNFFYRPSKFFVVQSILYLCSHSQCYLIHMFLPTVLSFFLRLPLFFDSFLQVYYGISTSLFFSARSYNFVEFSMMLRYVAKVLYLVEDILFEKCSRLLQLVSSDTEPGKSCH